MGEPTSVTPALYLLLNLATLKGGFPCKRKFCFSNQISRSHSLLHFEHERSVLVKNPTGMDFFPLDFCQSVDFLLCCGRPFFKNRPFFAQSCSISLFPFHLMYPGTWEMFLCSNTLC